MAIIRKWIFSPNIFGREQDNPLFFFRVLKCLLRIGFWMEVQPCQVSWLLRHMLFLCFQWKWGFLFQLFPSWVKNTDFAMLPIIYPGVYGRSGCCRNHTGTSRSARARLLLLAGPHRRERVRQPPRRLRLPAEHLRRGRLVQERGTRTLRHRHL